MGVDWISHTILGVKLNRDQCSTVLQKPGCQHDPDHHFEFCPKCGKQVRIAEEVLLECLEDGDWPDGIRQCTSTDEKDYFVGKIISCRDSFKENSVASMECEYVMSFREELKDILTQRGLWEPDQYKIWNVLYCG